MKTITIITPSNIEVEYKLAGVGSRIAAFIIDFLIQNIAYVLVVFIVMSINFQLQRTQITLQLSTAMGIIIALLFIINFGYFIVCELVMNGQTIGKRIFGLRVIRDNGQPIEFTQALIRGIIRSTLDLLYVGFFTIFFSKKHKRLGDMAAGTIVVIERRYTAKSVALNDSPMPSFIPHLSEMTHEEKAVVDSLLLRKESLPNNGLEIENKLKEYFAQKSAQNEHANKNLQEPALYSETSLE